MTLGPDNLKLNASDLRALFAATDTNPHVSLDIFDLAAIPIGIMGSSGYWLRANPAMSDLFGYGPDEFLGINGFDLVHPDDIAMNRKWFDQLHSGERDHASMEARGIHRSGETIWARFHVTPLRPSTRSDVYYLFQVEDITDLVASEFRLRQQSDLHETLIQHLPGVLVCVFDTELRFTLVEGQFHDALGLNGDMLVGRTPGELLSDPERVASVETVYRAALAGTAGSYELDRNGRHYEARVVPLPNGDGQVNAGLAVYIDTTDLKVAERSRQRRGEIYRSIVRNLPGAVASVFDKNLRYLVVEGHGLEMLGLEPDMVEGKTAYEYWGPDRRDEVVRRLEATIAGEPQVYDGVIGEREFVIRTAPIFEPDGSVEFGVVVNYDVTEAREHEREMRAVTEALAKSNRDLEEFASVAAHDLRAPLVTIQGLASILAEDYRAELDDDAAHLIDRIIVNANQMQTLLSEMLEISRIGRRESDFTATNLGEVVEHVRTHLEIPIKRRDVELTADIAHVTVWANWTRLVQLFTNLVDNAIKYTAPERSPQIAISASDEGDYWRISVADNGVGVPEDYRERVFEMFQRLRAGHDLNPQGTGLGLALVERIVGLHGGQIWIDPDVEDGTTFHLTLPKIVVGEDGEIE